MNTYDVKLKEKEFDSPKVAHSFVLFVLKCLPFVLEENLNLSKELFISN